MAHEGKERRKFARLDLALTVGYRVTDGPSKQIDPIEALSSDISLGGLRLMTPAPMKNGTRLVLDIQLEEDQSPIQAEAEVVWQTKHSATTYETGVIIKSMPPDDKSRFMSFVFDQMTKLVVNTKT